MPEAEATKKFTDEQLVSRYLKMRAFLEKEAEAQAAYVKGIVDGMTVIGGVLHQRLLDRTPNWKPGVKASGSAGGGTFFLKTDTSVKVADRQAFHEFVLANNATMFLTAHVAKEAVEEYQKEHSGDTPPGVTVDYIAKLQVRKT